MKIPDKVIDRLSLYHFLLEDHKDEENISSTKIAELLNIDNSQVRKDIQYIDNSGKRRVGYNVRKLKLAIEEKLGFKQRRNVFIVGAGNLGMALAKYSSFKNYGLNILALFDNDSKKIGNFVDGKEIFDITKVATLAKKMNVDFAILTVPREFAKGTAQYLAGAGIRYIWNFTPCILDVPHDVKVWNENLIGSFLRISNNDEVEEKENDNN